MTWEAHHNDLNLGINSYNTHLLSHFRVQYIFDSLNSDLHSRIVIVVLDMIFIFIELYSMLSFHAFTLKISINTIIGILVPSVQ